MEKGKMESIKRELEREGAYLKDALTGALTPDTPEQFEEMAKKIHNMK